jgi:hypothetical protein
MPQNHVILLPAKHVDTVIDIMAAKAALAHLDKDDIAATLHSAGAKDIHSFGLK